MTVSGANAVARHKFLLGDASRYPESRWTDATTGNSAPVIARAACEARNMITSATASGVTQRAAPMLMMRPPLRLRRCGKALFEATTAVFRLVS